MIQARKTHQSLAFLPVFKARTYKFDIFRQCTYIVYLFNPCLQECDVLLLSFIKKHEFSFRRAKEVLLYVKFNGYNIIFSKSIQNVYVVILKLKLKISIRYHSIALPRPDTILLVVGEITRKFI